MSYRITEYTKSRARAIGVEVKPSRTQGKKIDVFKNGKKVASVGALGYADYPTYMRLEKEGKVDKGVAAIRRKSYKARHQKDRLVRGSAGYYADQLLW
jgi:hypothetical protein